MSRRAGERWPCEACGTPLVGALTVRGRVAPIELDAARDGNVWLGRGYPPTAPVVCATLNAELRRAAVQAGIALHRNHFQSCPQADLFQHPARERAAAVA